MLEIICHAKRTLHKNVFVGVWKGGGGGGVVAGKGLDDNDPCRYGNIFSSVFFEWKMIRLLNCLWWWCGMRNRPQEWSAQYQRQLWLLSQSVNEMHSCFDGHSAWIYKRINVSSWVVVIVKHGDNNRPPLAARRTARECQLRCVGSTWNGMEQRRAGCFQVVIRSSLQRCLSVLSETQKGSPIQNELLLNL